MNSMRKCRKEDPYRKRAVQGPARGVVDRYWTKSVGLVEPNGERVGNPQGKTLLKEPLRQ